VRRRRVRRHLRRGRRWETERREKCGARCLADGSGRSGAKVCGGLAGDAAVGLNGGSGKHGRPQRFCFCFEQTEGLNCRLNKLYSWSSFKKKL
jgi:hypothetical protein